MCLSPAGLQQPSLFMILLLNHSSLFPSSLLFAEFLFYQFCRLYPPKHRGARFSIFQYSTLTRTSMTDIIFNLLYPQKVQWNNTLGIYVRRKPGVESQKGYQPSQCVPITTGSPLLLNMCSVHCARLQREGWSAVLLAHLNFSFVRASSFNLWVICNWYNLACPFLDVTGQSF